MKWLSKKKNKRSLAPPKKFGANSFSPNRKRNQCKQSMVRKQWTHTHTHTLQQNGLHHFYVADKYTQSEPNAKFRQVNGLKDPFETSSFHKSLLCNKISVTVQPTAGYLDKSEHIQKGGSRATSSVS